MTDREKLVEALVRERDEAREQQKAWADKWDLTTSAAEARIAKLEAALKVINEIARCDESFDASHRISWTARTALEAKP